GQRRTERKKHKLPHNDCRGQRRAEVRMKVRGKSPLQVTVRWLLSYKTFEVLVGSPGERRNRCTPLESTSVLTSRDSLELLCGVTSSGTEGC
ncbi:hypothetical protein CSUI_009483, partial [Cystoisospora suis]